MPKLDKPFDLNVLPQVHAKMLEDHFAYIGDEMLESYEYPASREEWEAQRGGIRAKLIESMGGFPEEACDLAPVDCGTLQRDGFRIEKWRLESRPGWYIAANIYVPDEQDGPLPGVICPHGHWATGKRSVHVQRRCINFARRGYVALSLDMVGYDERAYQDHRDTWYLMTTGMTLAGLHLYDNMRALDYLCGREEVDADRIGCTGASGGGNQTTYFSAIDERVKASAPVCSVDIYADYFRKAHCNCETVPGVVAYADQPHVLGLMAGRCGLLLVNAILDGGFPILRARQALDRAHRIFDLYNPESVDIHAVYDGHAYTQKFREGVYRWFDRWLKGPVAGARSHTRGWRTCAATRCWSRAARDCRTRRRSRAQRCTGSKRSACTPGRRRSREHRRRNCARQSWQMCSAGCPDRGRRPEDARAYRRRCTR